MLTYKKEIKESAIIVSPSIPPRGSVILLHGLGADGSDFLSIVPQLNLPDSIPLRFIFPNAPLRPVTINNGYVMRAWFDLYSLHFDQKVDEEGIKKSIATLQHLIKEEVEKGIPSENIILAGFSQGSVIALATGLTYSKRLAGILVLSGLLPNAEELIKPDSPNQHTPIFIGHGTEDEVVPFVLGQATYSVLKKHNYPVTFHPYRMGHSVCNEEISDIEKWIVTLFKDKK